MSHVKINALSLLLVTIKSIQATDLQNYNVHSTFIGCTSIWQRSIIYIYFNLYTTRTKDDCTPSTEQWSFNSYNRYLGEGAMIMASCSGRNRGEENLASCNEADWRTMMFYRLAGGVFLLNEPLGEQ